MTTVIITTTGFSESDLLRLYKYIKLHQELSPQHISGCPKFILPLSVWCYVLKDRAYMTWVQYNIATVPAISTVYYNTRFFICGLIKHTLLTGTSSFIVEAFFYFICHVIIGTVTVPYNLRSLNCFTLL